MSSWRKVSARYPNRTVSGNSVYCPALPLLRHSSPSKLIHLCTCIFSKTASSPSLSFIFIRSSCLPLFSCTGGIWATFHPPRQCPTSTFHLPPWYNTLERPGLTFVWRYSWAVSWLSAYKYCSGRPWIWSACFIRPNASTISVWYSWATSRSQRLCLVPHIVGLRDTWIIWVYWTWGCGRCWWKCGTVLEVIFSSCDPFEWSQQWL